MRCERSGLTVRRRRTCASGRSGTAPAGADASGVRLLRQEWSDEGGNTDEVCRTMPDQQIKRLPDVNGISASLAFYRLAILADCRVPAHRRGPCGHLAAERRAHPDGQAVEGGTKSGHSTAADQGPQ